MMARPHRSVAVVRAAVATVALATALAPSAMAGHDAVYAARRAKEVGITGCGLKCCRDEWRTTTCRPLSARDVMMGHLRPFGNQRPSDGHVRVLDYMPKPGEFYRDYVLPRRPVMFRGAQSGSTAVRQWTDEYLREHYGRTHVLIEAKYENRRNDPRRTTLRRFLQSYDRENMYIVTETPAAMYKDVLALNCLMCGSLAVTTEETNLWMSSGGTRSVIHHDADTLINCVVAGRKEWIFADWEHKFDFEMQQPRGQPSSSGSDFSDIDPDRVDLTRFDKVRDIPWQHAVAGPGDCVYLPFRHVHQVRSFGRNIAVTVMFLHPDQSGVPFSEAGCPGNHTELPVTTLDKHDFAWTYPGDGPITMGYMSPWVIRQFIKREFFDDGQRPVATFETVRRAFRDRMCEADPDNEPYGPLSRVEPLRARVKKFLRLIDLRPGGTLTIEVAMKWTRPMLKKIAMLADPPHDTMTEDELGEELGFPLAGTQADGTAAGPRTRLNTEHRLPGDASYPAAAAADGSFDFDRFVHRDQPDEGRPLPVPRDDGGSKQTLYQTQRAHLDNYRV
mmetsp:Transcript_32351/g.84680  ORF Transcript_32351/g.84680 Transcript_32351/m.84680 type:complete len:559 (-) Transcript_32351:163-1839(-)